MKILKKFQWQTSIGTFRLQNKTNRGFCSNMDLSDHAQILHTGAFEDKVFNEKSLSCRKLTVLEIFEFKVMISHRRNVKSFLFFLTLFLWEFIDFDVQVSLGYFRLG